MAHLQHGGVLLARARIRVALLEGFTGGIWGRAALVHAALLGGSEEHGGFGDRQAC